MKCVEKQASTSVCLHDIVQIMDSSQTTYVCARGVSGSLVYTTNMDAYMKLGRPYPNSNSDNVLSIMIMYFYPYPFLYISSFMLYSDAAQTIRY